MSGCCLCFSTHFIGPAPPIAESSEATLSSGFLCAFLAYSLVVRVFSLLPSDTFDREDFFFADAGMLQSSDALEMCGDESVAFGDTRIWLTVIPETLSFSTA